MTVQQSPEYMTTEEVAKALGVSRRWVQVLVKDGDLPSYRPGRRTVLVLRKDFEAYQAAHAYPGKEGPERPQRARKVPEAPKVQEVPGAPVGRIVVDLGQFT